MKKLSKIIDRTEIKEKKLDSNLIYILENGNQVGSLILVYEGNDIASIFSLYILEKNRGNGYARDLMNHAIKVCKRRNVDKICLNTELDNDPANKLYKSMGFKVMGIDDGFFKYELSM
jgi:ribosomal protein S18 acetylase RimI-like enzyme